MAPGGPRAGYYGQNCTLFTAGRPAGRQARLATLTIVAISTQIHTAAAFPLTEEQVPQGTELAAPDTQQLRQQLDLAQGVVPPLGGGWTFLPFVNIQEMLTDNALLVHSPRQWDLVTYLSPGIQVAGDMPRLRLTFDYAPALTMYARTSSMNALTQQMNGLGQATLVPDLLFVDVRALAGVQNLYGGIGGLGTLGTVGATAGTQQASVTGLGTTAGTGLNRNNEVQTASFGISPYLLRQFGDWGTGKLGYSFNYTSSNQLSGFAASPFPTGGNNAQTLLSNEEIAQFTTGEFLGRLKNSIDVNLLQSQTNNGYGYAYGVTATGAPYYGPAQSYTSIRNYYTDTVTYQLNHTIAVFGSGGWEDITYGQAGVQSVHDMTWSFGTTLTPSPDTALTLSYGHRDGFNSFSANGHVAVTARTMLTVSYGSSTGTQLEYLRSQMNLAAYNNNGALVNGQTGGQLYGGSNTLPVQNGIFRTDTLTIGSQTILERDSLSATLVVAKQTPQGSAASTATTAKTISGQWLHQMRPDLTLSAAASFSAQDGTFGFGGPGNSTSVAASVGLQYQISDKLSASLRYSFVDRQSRTTAYSYSANMLTLGISKSF